MPKKKTEREYKDELAIKNPNAKLLGTYVNAKTKTTFLCLKHNKEWLSVPDIVLKGCGCPQCHSEKTRNAKVWSREQYIEVLAKRNPTVELVGEYTNTITKTEHRCTLHNICWKVTPANVLDGKGCRKCHGERISATLKKTQSQYIKDLKDKHPAVILVGDYIDDKTKTMHRCLIHDMEWLASPGNVLSGKGCPECKRSKISAKKRKTEGEYVSELELKNPTVKLAGEYYGATQKTRHFCTIHNAYYETAPTNALKGCGCPQCHLERNWYKRRKTHDQYVEEVLLISPHIHVVDKYIDSKTPIKHYCSIHERYWDASPSSILNGSSCPDCCKAKIRRKQLLDPNEYLRRIALNNPDAKPLEPYIDSKTPIAHLHKKCGHVTKMLPSSALSGAGCVLCKGEKIRKAFVKSQVDFEFALSFVNPDIKVIGEYKATTKKIECECLICGNRWNARASHLLEGHGCPKCNEPIGEKQIRSFVECFNIPYIKNKTFEGLIGIGGNLLSYDFMIPNYRLLIEFQGDQHNRPVEYFGGEKQFAIQQEHDRRKREYAKQHGFHLLEIEYKDIEKIPSILAEYLSTIKSETVTTAGIAQ